MLKELIICIIIIIAIFSLDMFTEKYTKNTVNEVVNILSDIKENILNENVEKVKDEIDDLQNKWNEKKKKLAYYLEHDELEKFETAIVTMKSYVETKDYSSAIAELEEGKFVLEHIQEKNALELENIF